MTGQQIQIIGGAIIYAMYAQTVNTNRCPEERGDRELQIDRDTILEAKEKLGDDNAQNYRSGVRDSGF